MTLPIKFRLPFCHIFLSTLHHSLTDLTSKTSPGRSSRPVVTQPKLMIFPNQQQHKCLIPMHVQHFCLGNILPLHSSYFRHPAVPIIPATPCYKVVNGSPSLASFCHTFHQTCFTKQQAYMNIIAAQPQLHYFLGSLAPQS